MCRHYALRNRFSPVGIFPSAHLVLPTQPDGLDSRQSANFDIGHRKGRSNTCRWGKQSLSVSHASRSEHVFAGHIVREHRLHHGRAVSGMGDPIAHSLSHRHSTTLLNRVVNRPADRRRGSPQGSRLRRCLHPRECITISYTPPSLHVDLRCTKQVPMDVTVHRNRTGNHA